MNLTQAKQIAPKFPKQIGSFKRPRVNYLRNTTTLNYMIYNNGNQSGAVIGDGHVYGLKFVKVEKQEGCKTGKTLVPNLDKVLA